MSSKNHLTTNTSRHHQKNSATLKNRHYNILLVEDDETLNKLVSNYLSERGHTVHSAHLLNEALNLIAKLNDESAPINLALLDLELAGENGGKVAEKLRESSKDTKIVFCSGRPRYELQRLVSEGKGDAYVAKPFFMPELLAITGL